MTDEFVLTLKNILDNTGIQINVEQLETGLNATADERPIDVPLLDEAIGKTEMEGIEKGTDAMDSKGISMPGRDNCYVISGPALMEYNGRVLKKFEGDMVLILKPDNSIIIHGLHGVKPVSYLARAQEIWSRGSNGTFTIEAISGNDRLITTFRKIYSFERLFKELSHETEKPREEKSLVTKHVEGETTLTEEENALRIRLKKLRIDLAHSNGITFLPAIFDNRMLYALIKQRPATTDDLKKVKGFGEKRIERYGDTILKAIQAPTTAPA